jgi:DNA-directed RNA polymerase sigma subunit (sigma70/sigma32)
LSTEQVDVAAYVRAVTNAANRVAGARDRLEFEVRAASSAGLSLRQIAAAAGVSHERVRQIVAAGD